MKRIVALIDFSDVTPAVVKIARDMARAFNIELVLVHVVVSDSEFADDELEKDTSRSAIEGRLHHREMDILGLGMKKEGVAAITKIVHAKSPGENVVKKILQEVHQLSPDLIVLGSHGHGRLHQLLAGSVTDTVVRKAICPVLIVPSRSSG